MSVVARLALAGLVFCSCRIASDIVVMFMVVVSFTMVTAARFNRFSCGCGAPNGNDSCGCQQYQCQGPGKKPDMELGRQNNFNFFTEKKKDSDQSQASAKDRLHQDFSLWLDVGVPVIVIFMPMVTAFVVLVAVIGVCHRQGKAWHRFAHDCFLSVSALVTMLAGAWLD